MTTHVIMILDASSSMIPYRSETIVGYNSYIADLEKDEHNEYTVTTVTFSSHNYFHIHASKLKPGDPNLIISAADYTPRGNTALLDATGRVVTEFKQTHGGLGENDKVIVVTTTDGEENDSREFSYRTIKALMDALRDTGKWEFVFLAQGFDGWTQASRMGYRDTGYVGTQVVSRGTVEGGYRAASTVTGDFSRGMRVNTSAALVNEIGPELVRPVRPAVPDKND